MRSPFSVPPSRRLAIELVALAVIVVLGVAAAPAIASSTTPFQQVLVVNPASSPVPVTLQGTGAISGTVNVGNFPSTQPVSGTVTVGNSTSSPVPVVDVNGSATEPVSFTGLILISAGNVGNEITCYTVPAGKRLVIQQVSVLGEASGLQVVEAASVGSGDRLFAVMHDEGPFYGADKEISVGSQFGVAYVNAGATVFCSAQRSGDTGGASASFFVAGYLVDLP